MGKFTERRDEMYGLAMEVRDYYPQFADNMKSNVELVYGEGALPAYVKRLMALVGALVHGCEGCILAQTNGALEKGATPEQVMEACHVAMMLGGTMAMAESTRVLGFMKDKGLM